MGDLMSMLNRQFLESRMGILPGLQTITLTRPSDSSLSLSIPGTKRKSIRYDKIARQDNVAYENVGCVFLIPDSVMRAAGTEPQNSDVITDEDGRRWIIESVNPELMQSMWRCPVFEEVSRA